MIGHPRLVSIFSASLLFVLTSLASAEGDAKPTKGTVRCPDGLNIVYDVRGQGDTALVFIHGWCCDRESWKHQVDEFAKDYRVVTLDLAGHGESGKDRKEWSVKGLAADVEAVIKQLGLKRVILVGHSMGGPVALATAKRLPGTCVGVIGVDTLQNVEFKWPEDQAKHFLDGFEADFKGTMRGALKGMFPEKVDPELVKWIADKAEAQDQKMALGLMRDMTKLDSPTLMKEAKVPVRCINSGPGFQFQQPTATDINKKYGDFNVVMIEGVGHYPMLEKPAEFNTRLRTTLKEFGAKK